MHARGALSQVGDRTRINETGCDLWLHKPRSPCASRPAPPGDCLQTSSRSANRAFVAEFPTSTFYAAGQASGAVPQSPCAMPFKAHAALGGVCPTAQRPALNLRFGVADLHGRSSSCVLNRNL